MHLLQLSSERLVAKESKPLKSISKYSKRTDGRTDGRKVWKVWVGVRLRDTYMSKKDWKRAYADVEVTRAYSTLPSAF